MSKKGLEDLLSELYSEDEKSSVIETSGLGGYSKFKEMYIWYFMPWLSKSFLLILKNLASVIQMQRYLSIQSNNFYQQKIVENFISSY